MKKYSKVLPVVCCICMLLSCGCSVNETENIVEVTLNDEIMSEEGNGLNAENSTDITEVYQDFLENKLIVEYGIAKEADAHSLGMVSAHMVDMDMDGVHELVMFRIGEEYIEEYDLTQRKLIMQLYAIRENTVKEVGKAHFWPDWVNGGDVWFVQGPQNGYIAVRYTDSDCSTWFNAYEYQGLLLNNICDLSIGASTFCTVSTTKLPEELEENKNYLANFNVEDYGNGVKTIELFDDYYTEEEEYVFAQDKEETEARILAEKYYGSPIEAVNDVLGYLGIGTDDEYITDILPNDGYIITHLLIGEAEWQDGGGTVLLLQTEMDVPNLLN